LWYIFAGKDNYNDQIPLLTGYSSLKQSLPGLTEADRIRNSLATAALSNKTNLPKALSNKTNLPNVAVPLSSKKRARSTDADDKENSRI
jgi:hypothetical protein